MFYGRVQATAVHDATGSVQYFLRRLRGRDGRDRGDERAEASEARLRGDHRQLAGHHRGALSERALGSEQAGEPACSATTRATRRRRRPLRAPPSRRRAHGGRRAERGARRQPDPEGTDRAPPPGVRRQLLDVRVRRPEPRFRRRGRRCRRHGPQRRPSASGPSARTGRPKSGSVPRSSTRRCASPSSISTARILDINAAGAALMQSTREALIGTDARGVCAPGRSRARASRRRREQISGIDAIAEFRMVRPDGSMVWVMSRAALFTPDEDRPPYVISLADRHHRAAQPRGASRASEATTDPLTGLLNRNAFMSHVQLALTSRTRQRSGCCSSISTGSRRSTTPAGTTSATRCSSMSRARSNGSRAGGDIVARLGGDEFVVLCHGVDTGDDRDGRVTRGRRGVRADRRREPHIIQVGASVGGALATADRRSDRACCAGPMVRRTRRSGRAVR